ncbi:MAG: hypothetical protein ACYST6_03760 [Planctomycetota bacterium]|jgi:hypothetical protein
MMMKTLSSTLCWIVLSGLLLLVPACKKSPPSGPSQDTEQQAHSETDEVSKPPAAEDSNAQQLVPLDIKLPRPVFGETPPNLQSLPNLEEVSSKPREPFYAPVGTTNVALGKPVTSTDKEPIWGDLGLVTDGDKEATDGSYVELGPSLQSITIDLGAPHYIYAILFWHYHKQPQYYFDVVVQVADEADFLVNVRMLFNNDDDNSSGLGIGTDMNYVETYEGRLVDARGTRARYVRLYSNGNNNNDLNHYTEVEVFGKPAK